MCVKISTNDSTMRTSKCQLAAAAENMQLNQDVNCCRHREDVDVEAGMVHVVVKRTPSGCTTQATNTTPTRQASRAGLPATVCEAAVDDKDCTYEDAAAWRVTLVVLLPGT
jgi:hypothetical protein